MKHFEFRLKRVLDIRRQQLEAHRGRLSALIASLNSLEMERETLEKNAAEARASVRGNAVTGSDLASLAHYESHIRRMCAALAKRRSEIEQQLKIEQDRTREAQRKVKLLEKLESKRRAEWQSGVDKELESLAADAHLARRQSLVRAERATAEYGRRVAFASEVDV